MHTNIDPNCHHCVYRVCCGLCGPDWERSIHSRFPNLDSVTAYVVYNQWIELESSLRQRLERETAEKGEISQDRYDKIVIDHTYPGHASSAPS